MIERLCNEVAAEALVPTAEFESEWKHAQSGYGQIERLARHFLVSGLVIIRRARELNKISANTFGEFWAEAMERIEAHASAKAKDLERAKDKDKQSGNFYTTLEARNSPTLVTALLRDVKQGGTLLSDAARLLSMKDGRQMDGRIYVQR